MNCEVGRERVHSHTVAAYKLHAEIGVNERFNLPCGIFPSIPPPPRSVYGPVVGRAPISLSDPSSTFFAPALARGHPIVSSAACQESESLAPGADFWQRALVCPALDQTQGLWGPGKVMKGCDKCLAWQTRQMLASWGVPDSSSCPEKGHLCRR